MVAVWLLKIAFTVLAVSVVVFAVAVVIRALWSTNEGRKRGADGSG